MVLSCKFPAVLNVKDRRYKSRPGQLCPEKNQFTMKASNFWLSIPKGVDPCER